MLDDATLLQKAHDSWTVANNLTRPERKEQFVDILTELEAKYAQS